MEITICTGSQLLRCCVSCSVKKGCNQNKVNTLMKLKGALEIQLLFNRLVLFDTKFFRDE